MPADELLQSLILYGVFSFCGLLGWPLLARLLKRRVLAWSAGRLFGLLVFAWPVWFLASAGALDYQHRGMIAAGLAACIAAVIGASLHNTRFAALKCTLKQNWRWLLALEGTALAAYLGYLYLRSFNPDAFGTERFMDMAFFVASARTRHFPFIDPWLAGAPVNYYYYGSFLMGLLANLSAVPTALAYNFALALVFSEAVVLSAGIVLECTASAAAAALAAILITCSGSIFYAAGEIRALVHPGSAPYSWTNSTRFYDPSYIINEVPSYSFTVGDLHAHVLALPFFLLNLALLFCWYRAPRPQWPLLAAMTISLATSAMVNSWDVVTLFLVFAFITAAKAWPTATHSRQRLLWLAALALSAVGVLTLMYPFLRTFQSPVMGVGFAPSFVREYHLKDVQYPTPAAAWFGLWGMFVLAIGAALVRVRDGRNRGFACLLAGAAAALLAGVELFFVRDIYSVANPPFFRANTVFKFGYHAWTMLAIASSVLLSDAYRGRQPVQPRAVRLGAAAVTVSLAAAFLLTLIYPWQAVEQFYLSNREQRRMRDASVDASLFMKQEGPGDYETVRYLAAHAPDRWVLVEAAGDSYTYHGRLSAFTGMIDPIGWVTHEWTWRFDARSARRARPGQNVETGYSALADRQNDIRDIYETSDIARAAALLRKYDARFVYVGALERTDYPKLDEPKFYRLGNLVFSSHGADLFRIDDSIRNRQD
ncbi:MAG TPA: DUF2298 domain-containing protein [Bryobacteraceae bacterium]|nr:DUF2298 domain-containing protein [Bryobacteraceae bacterium]